MGRLATVALLLTAASANATKAGSFEDAIAEAKPAGDLAQIVEPFFAECKGSSNDDFETRQCIEVRDWLKRKALGQTWWAVGDETAISWQPFDPSEKKLGLEISGCLACGRPVTVEGKLRFVTTRVPMAIKGGHAVGLELGFQDLPVKDAAEAAAFQKKMQSRLRVQFVFKLGQNWKSGSFEGLTFVPTAYRVFDKCTGKVVASDPPSLNETAVVMRDASCPEELSPEEHKRRQEAALPEQLSPNQINQALAKTKTRIHDCYAEFQQSGTARIDLIVERDGSISDMKLQPPFARTDTGYCIQTAIKGTTFPRFKGDRMRIPYSFNVQ
jgi:hypothetical protein